MPASTDIVICGGGIIGLSLALELQRRGAKVVVLEQSATRAEGQASWAAAGMLAVDDPHNPTALHDFSRWSRGLYDEFIARVEGLSGLCVPFQTQRTRQWTDDDRVIELAEQSLNPRELMRALEQAVPQSGVTVVRGARVVRVEDDADAVRVFDADGGAISARSIVHAAGAWYAGAPAIKPSKGQMLRVRLALEDVHRSAAMYIAPRHFGEQAGTALVGATVEDVGFDTTIDEATIKRQLQQASELVPAVRDAEVIEVWSGLRPTASDLLPVIGGLPGKPQQWIAGGHFRNGILLAPGTAVAMADALEGKGLPQVVKRFIPR